MTFAECYSTLGVQQGASLREAHAAYKRLAFRHHPDRNGDTEENRRVFCRITEAYARLRGLQQAQSQSKHSGECRTCGNIGELFIGLHGNVACAECLLGKRRRYLPMPTYRQIRCIAAIILLLFAGACLIKTVLHAELASAFAGIGSVLGALASLGFNVYAADIIET